MAGSLVGLFSTLDECLTLLIFGSFVTLLRQDLHWMLMLLLNEFAASTYVSLSLAIAIYDVEP